MRVVLVINGLTHAGAETQLMGLARSLRRRGDEVGLLSILPNEAFLDDLVTLGIPAVECRLRPGLRAASAMADGIRILRAWQPDAVVSFLFQADMLARVAGRLARVPVIISSIRNERVPGLGRERLIRLTDRLCTLTTTNSELSAKALVERGVVPRERLVVVPNGVDICAFTPPPPPARRAQIRMELGVVEDQFLWLAAGRLEAQKDYPTLLRAMAGIGALGADPVLRIAGQGPLRTEIEALAVRLGIAERTQLLGLRTDVADLLAAADAVVLSSAFEGLPNIVLEAMAAGRPVVASRVGGVPELVSDGVTGTTVNPGRPDELGRAMSDMMAMPEETRLSMGSAATSLVASRFSVDAVTGRWAALLDREVARHPRPHRDRVPMSASVL